MPSWDDVAEEAQGGLLMAYDGVVTDAYFAKHSGGGNKLVIETRLDHPEDYPFVKDGKKESWYWLPKGWTPQRNGASAVNTLPNEKTGEISTKFWAASSVGQLVTQLRTIDPEGKTLTNGLPTEAAYWKGLGHVRFGPVPVPNREKDDTTGKYKTVGTNDVSMPVELLDTASPAEDFDVSILGWDPTTLDLARAAAASAKDYAGFVQAAVPAMPGNPALQAITSKDPGERIFAALKPF